MQIIQVSIPGSLIVSALSQAINIRARGFVVLQVVATSTGFYLPNDGRATIVAHTDTPPSNFPQGPTFPATDGIPLGHFPIVGTTDKNGSWFRLSEAHDIWYFSAFAFAAPRTWYLGVIEDDCSHFSISEGA